MDAEAWEDRLQERLHELGNDEPRCGNPDCNERNPFALTGAHPAIFCYECKAIAQGRQWVEGDHFFAQHDDPRTDLIPGNDHRIRNEHQTQDWPRERCAVPTGPSLA